MIQTQPPQAGKQSHQSHIGIEPKKDLFNMNFISGDKLTFRKIRKLDFKDKFCEECFKAGKQSRDKNIQAFLKKAKKRFCLAVMSFDDESPCDKCHRCLAINIIAKEEFGSLAEVRKGDEV